ncbi:MAG: hypothetical protein ABWX94_00855 [Candidatus Saccharimonadales bacterium]
MSERIAQQVKSIGLEQEAVVITGGALEAAGIRTASDIDMSVDISTFMALRELHDWQEGVSPIDGTRIVSRDNFEVGLAPLAKIGHFALRQRSYEIDGVKFASLADTYAQKQLMRRPKDAADLRLVRERLLDRPLDAMHSKEELSFVQTLLPEHLHEHPAAQVAANGLYMVRVIFGKKEDSRNFGVRTYSGDFETFPVLSTYHDFAHTADGMARLPRQARLANMHRKQFGLPPMYDDSDLLAMLAGYAYHDCEMGHGRMASNPMTYDELRSARLVQRHLILSGCVENDIPQKAYQGIRATTFNQKKRSQDVDWSRGYGNVQLALAGTDLGKFPEPAALENSMQIAFEDGHRIIFDRPLGLKAAEVGQPYSMMDVAEMIDGDKELVRWLGNTLVYSGAFCRDHEYPQGWMLDNHSKRMANATAIADLGHGLLSGNLSATDALRVASPMRGYRPKPDTSHILF